MKFFLHLSYHGTQYRGWQRQKSVISVQETLERAFSKMLKNEISVIGCGRTDAEVHASQFVAHFSLDENSNFDIIERLNLILPEDIVVHEYLPVPDKAHAQFDAVSRTYTYLIHHERSPFIPFLSSFYSNDSLDLQNIIDPLSKITLIEDFRSLCISPNSYEHTICRVSEVSLFVNKSEKRMAFQITSNRFLRGMVRLLIGNMMEAAYGRLDSKKILEDIQNKKQILPARYAFPQGLYLSEVRYPKTNFAQHPSHDFRKKLNSDDWTRII